jgi:hypothetical protein
MKTLILFVALAILSQLTAFSQGCLPEGITFTTQEQIDSFQVDYPGCTEIEGNVEILGSLYSKINNLNGLEILQYIDGFLWIDSTQITNLWGLNNLVSIGDWFHITFCPSLLNLSGLESLVNIDGQLGIAFSEVNDFTGVPSLAAIGGLDLYFTGTETLTGLEGLTFINGSIGLDNCSDLTSVTGLENLTAIHGSLYIFLTHLSNLAGLGNIEANSLTNINITFNDYLSECVVQSVCEYLAAPNGTIEIHNNAPGCNSPEEVQLACQTAIDENKTEELTLFPNPASSFITLTTSQGEPIEEAIIYNHLGQKVLTTKPMNNRVDVSGLKAGMYFIEMTAEESWKPAKFVKK